MQLADDLAATLQLAVDEAQPAAEARDLVRVELAARAERQGLERLRTARGAILDAPAAATPGNQQQRAGCRIDHDGQIEIAHAVDLGFDQHAFHPLTARAGLLGHESTTEEPGRRGSPDLGRLGDMNTAGLRAVAGEHLRLHHHRAGAELTNRPFGPVRRGRQRAGRARDGVASEQSLCLTFLDFHGVSLPCRNTLTPVSVRPSRSQGARPEALYHFSGIHNARLPHILQWALCAGTGSAPSRLPLGSLAEGV